MTDKHFHVWHGDAGYLPNNNDDASLYLTVEDAISSVEWELDSHADYYSQIEETETIRGQISHDGNVTVADELQMTEKTLEEIRRNLSNAGWVRDVSENGLMVALEDGISYVEISVCQETYCEEDYREALADSHGNECCECGDSSHTCQNCPTFDGTLSVTE